VLKDLNRVSKTPTINISEQDILVQMLPGLKEHHERNLSTISLDTNEDDFLATVSVTVGTTRTVSLTPETQGRITATAQHEAVITDRHLAIPNNDLNLNAFLLV
jgi:hypothetical protein